MRPVSEQPAEGPALATVPAFSRRERLEAHLLRAVSVRRMEQPEDDPAVWDAWREESTRRFFARLPPWLDFEGKRVLDVGSGYGNTCIEAVRRGAREVLGVEIDADSVAAANAKLSGDVELASRCRFLLSDVAALGGEDFDLVLSQDSMEHYGEPERFVEQMLRPLAPGGLFVVGFGPLWKAPLGGHIGFLTKVPWAHLIFSERVIMAERSRYRPEEAARTYDEVRGGLNQMTLARFRKIMEATGFRCLYFETNRGEHPATRAMRLLSRVPALREYLTTNVYSVWRKPDSV